MASNACWASASEQRLQKALPTLQMLVAKGQQKNAQVLTIRDHAMRCLEEHGLIMETTTHSDHVGVHPRNRGGIVLIDMANVRSKVKAFKVAGFSFKEVERAVVVERSGMRICENIHMNSCYRSVKIANNATYCVFMN